MTANSDDREPAGERHRLELLPADQRVEQVGDHEHRDDEAEEVGAAHVRDEEAEGQAKASYPIDSLDHQQQDREHHDPENDCRDIHADRTIDAARHGRVTIAGRA